MCERSGDSAQPSFGDHLHGPLDGPLALLACEIAVDRGRSQEVTRWPARTSSLQSIAGKSRGGRPWTAVEGRKRRRRTGDVRADEMRAPAAKVVLVPAKGRAGDRVAVYTPCRIYIERYFV